MESLVVFFLYKLLFVYLLYWMFSILFFILPIFHIQNKFRPKCKKNEGVWSIAHRGGSREGLENTLPTFKKAFEKGAQILEMDIQITKDKMAVVCHDNNLKRLCGVDSDISSLTYSELPPIQSKVDLHFSEDQYHTTDNDDRKIPLLEDLMKEFPDVPFNMELKQRDDELKREVLRLIRKYKRESITIWGSIDENHCLQMKRMAPEVPTFTPVQTVARLSLFFLIGYLPFYRIPYDTFQFPYVNSDYISFKHKYSGATLGVKLNILLLKVFNFFAWLIFYHLRQRRIYVFYYTVNNVDDFTTAMGKGIDGIITDSPGLLVNHIHKKLN